VKNRVFKSALLGACTIVAAGASYGLIPHKNYEEHKRLEQDILITAKLNQYTNYIEPTVHLPESEISQELEHTVKSGENLSSIFSALDLSREDLHKIVHANAVGKMFAEVEPGHDVAATVNASGELEQLTYSKNPRETLIATRHDDDFDVKVLSKKVDFKTATAKGTITSSLFEDGKKAGLPEKLILKLADIFAWDIDFALNLQDGDEFTVVYEKLYVDGKEFDSGDILSVEFVNHNKAYTAVRFTDDKGSSSYYTPEGNALRKAFCKPPWTLQSSALILTCIAYTLFLTPYAPTKAWTIQQQSAHQLKQQVMAKSFTVATKTATEMWLKFNTAKNTQLFTPIFPASNPD
jgi:hypothetical protein